MYVYMPGAGCSGDAKLVAPGDELIFSNAKQWEKRQSPVLSQVASEPLIASTCPPSEISRPFKEPLPAEAMRELSHKNFSAETLKKVRWVQKMYHEWRSYRHSLGLEYITCDLEDCATITGASLAFALCHYITQVKKVDGSDFPAKSLYDIVICVQFHLECLGFAFCLVNNPYFSELKYTLDNTMKERVQSGIGLSLRQAEVLSVIDEDNLWSLGYLGCANPVQLLNTVVFCVGKGFALRAGKEHRVLCAMPFDSQLKFICDSDNEYFLRYTEDIGLKINKGGLRHKKVDVKSVDLYAMDR